MKREFIVERQGRAFVLYAGLLDMAHSQGLQSIRTELIQIPTEENRCSAICFATVTMRLEGIETVFTGIGDANPLNVPNAMQQCLIRMSETRAKARALRDAVNVGVASIEEMADDEQNPSSNRSASTGFTSSNRSIAQRNPDTRFQKYNASPANVALNTGKPQMANTMIKPETDAASHLLLKPQREAIRSLCRRGGINDDILASERFGAKDADHLTNDQASDLIKSMQDQLKRGIKSAA